MLVAGPNDKCSRDVTNRHSGRHAVERKGETGEALAS